MHNAIMSQHVQCDCHNTCLCVLSAHAARRQHRKSRLHEEHLRGAGEKTAIHMSSLVEQKPQALWRSPVHEPTRLPLPVCLYTQPPCCTPSSHQVARKQRVTYTPAARQMGHVKGSRSGGGGSGGWRRRLGGNGPSSNHPASLPVFTSVAPGSELSSSSFCRAPSVAGRVALAPAMVPRAAVSKTTVASWRSRCRRYTALQAWAQAARFWPRLKRAGDSPSSTDSSCTYHCRAGCNGCMHSRGTNGRSSTCFGSSLGWNPV